MRVLDFGHILAGPYCARLLADLGADVVKIESRSRAEGMGRTKLGPGWQGRRDRSPHMLMVNRNKRSVTLDLKNPAGVETAARLAAAADVLVENFSAGAMDRLELGWQHLQPRNPRLIYLSLSGYGHAGPRREWTSMNLNLQAYSGLMMATGAEGDPPTTIAASWNDYLGALHGCVAVLNALVERAQTGLGANLDLSQFECSVASLGPLLLAGAVNGCPPRRLASRSESAAPQGCYRCAGQDQWCAVSVHTAEQWQALLDVIPALREPRFADVSGRQAHADELDSLIEGWTSRLPATEVETRLQAAGVPAERMRRAKDLLADNARLFPPLEDPPGQHQLMSTLPFTLGVTELFPSPRIGQHTESVLQDWLGLSAPEIDQLNASGALN